ncbi:hypothetical protein ACUNV4_28285 [Granulosicoccus sp. 3-233]|uniref:hypothetical protein n=1 Tax=Granulosicoccus sp. 3-233 TaxID=3417969 RepID=UPI003D328EC0
MSFRNGVEQIHDWTLNDQGQVIALDRRGEGAEQTTPASTSSTNSITERQPEDAPQVQRYPHDVLTVLSLSEMGYPATVQYSLDRDATTHLLESEYDQTGRLVDVKWLSGVLEDFNDGQVVTGDDVIRYANRSKATGRNREVAFAALARMGQIAGMASEFLEQTSKELTVGSLVTGQELDQAWWSNAEKSGRHGSGQTRKARNSSEAGAADPCQDPLEDCASLLRTRDYAEVAECAYIDADCSTRFVEADLASLGLELRDLHDGSFHAEIFHDRENEEYIVSFAGTDFVSGGDWLSNIEQEFGFSAFQYEKAVRLAGLLAEVVPSDQLTFVGHSLGGGLATAAAGTGAGDAIVFNPAALTQESAGRLNIDYESSASNTTIYSVSGELLSDIQTNIDFTNEPPGNFHLMRRPSFSWIKENVDQNSRLTYGVRIGVTLHGMKAVRQSLAESIDRNLCV